MKTIILLLCLLTSLSTVTATAQLPGNYLPDGTVVYSSKPNHVIGRVARRWATRAQGYPSQHTHAGIVLGGRVYHADFPRVESKPISQFKRGEVACFVLPPRPYTPQQVAAMKAYAQSQLGKPYRLRGFIFRTDDERYCSPFVKNVLNRAGHNLSWRDGFTPDNLKRAVR